MHTIKTISALLRRRSCWRLPSSNASFSSAAEPAKTSSSPQLVLEQLSSRNLILVEGEEAVPFIQGLVTNDVSHLQDPTRAQAGVTSLYTMFLNKAGRVLYDSIIYRTSDPKAFLIECDEQASKALSRHLKIYRVRKSIRIETMESTFKPWVLFNPNADGQCDGTAVNITQFPELATIDPRLVDLGIRFVYASDKNYDDVEKFIKDLKAELNIAPPSARNSYRYHRYRLGIGEGVQDFPLEKCFPLETNADFLNGVSFNKGCYLGQELTARVHHTGVVRKRIMPLLLTAPNPENASVVQNESEANVGSVKGTCEDRALGLLRVEQVLKASKLLVGGQECHVEKPYWWPPMASKTVANEVN